ncbi:hypothetical protein Xthr_08235 [Xanthomonas citri pv. thirumalacharii]|nr:hypothetical protein [Xanthomonas citri pv. thirumalacharii]
MVAAHFFSLLALALRSACFFSWICLGLPDVGTAPLILRPLARRLGDGRVASWLPRWDGVALS